MMNKLIIVVLVIFQKEKVEEEKQAKENGSIEQKMEVAASESDVRKSFVSTLHKLCINGS